MALYRPQLTARKILDSRALAKQPDGAIVYIAGQVVMHQAPPTAKGHHFVTLEDEYGMLNVIVRPAIYAIYTQIIRESPLLMVEAELQRKGPVMNLLARRVAPMVT